MIKLEVEDYCQDCRNFEADVQRPNIYHAMFGEEFSSGDTIVRCEYRKHCKHVVEFVKKKEEEQN